VAKVAKMLPDDSSDPAVAELKSMVVPKETKPKDLLDSGHQKVQDAIAARDQLQNKKKQCVENIMRLEANLERKFEDLDKIDEELVRAEEAIAASVAAHAKVAATVAAHSEPDQPKQILDLSSLSGEQAEQLLALVAQFKEKEVKAVDPKNDKSPPAPPALPALPENGGNGANGAAAASEVSGLVFPTGISEANDDVEVSVVDGASETSGKRVNEDIAKIDQVKVKRAANTRRVQELAAKTLADKEKAAADAAAATAAAAAQANAESG